MVFGWEGGLSVVWEGGRLEGGTKRECRSVYSGKKLLG